MISRLASPAEHQTCYVLGSPTELFFLTKLEVVFTIFVFSREAIFKKTLLTKCQLFRKERSRVKPKLQHLPEEDLGTSIALNKHYQPA